MRPGPAAGALAVALALLLSVVGCSTRPDGDRPGSSRTGADPVAAADVRTRLLLAPPAEEGEEDANPTFRTLVGLIDATPPGERIRITGNSFTFMPAARALVAAHERGVEVQVLLHVVSRQWRAPALLHDALGADPRAGSFVRIVAGGLHQKVWSFTRTAGVPDVTLVGSMNLTYYSGRQYTDMVMLARERGLRRVLDRRFRALLRQLPDVAPSAGPVDVAGLRLWSYPGPDGTDPVLEQLAAVPPRGARIRVAMYAWLDDRGAALARLLADKAASGARVQVVLGPSVGPLPRRILEESAVEVHEGVFDDGQDLHLKLTVVEHPGTEGRRGFVLTGSDNFTTRSLTRPELLVRLDRRRWTVRYATFVDRLVRRAVREDGPAR